MSSADPARTRNGKRLLGELSVFGIAVVIYVGLDPVLRDWGLPFLARWVVWAFIASVWLLPFVVLRDASRSDRYADARLPNPYVLATMCAVSASGVLVLLRSTRPPLALIGSIAGICAVAVAVWLAVFVYARTTRHVPARRRVRTATARDAERLVAACRDELGQSSLPYDQRASVELNLAGALVILFQQADREDALAEACAIFERALVAPSPARRFAAAEQLVEAMTVKAERSGDLGGYERSLDLLVEAAAQAEPVIPEAPSGARAICARSLVRRFELEANDARELEAERLRQRAVHEIGLAIKLAAPGSVLHAEHMLVLAPLAAEDPEHGDLDAAIVTCRRALRRLWGQDWAVKAPGYLALADLLAKRAVSDPDGGIGGWMDSLWPDRPRHGIVDRLWPDRASNDLARALAICMRLSFQGELGPQVMKRVPELNYQLRMSLKVGPGIRPVGWMYRHAFEAQARISPASAVDLAARWARWAALRGDPKRAADAHWSWITAVVGASRRRAFLEDKQHQLVRIQGRIAEACRWLLDAQRPCDATVAIELGRAVLLTERMQRERPELEQRLMEAGRSDLRDRWREARDRIQDADRDGFGEEREQIVSQRSETSNGGLASPAYLALAGHEQLLREIGELPGFEDVVATLDYDDLREAAHDGPVVYICAMGHESDDEGFALVVTDDPEPELVTLPGLTVAASETRATRLIGLEGAHEVADEYELQRTWLWETVMQPITAGLAPGSLVTLIPVGVLGQLPLHAACAAPDERGVWQDLTDGLVFRFAPNARVLLRARRTARAFTGESPRVLTVPVADAPDAEPLPHALDESAGVQAIFGAERTSQPAASTIPSVLDSLDGCAIWHFACHGFHHADDPLESLLLLDDGPLTLRTIMSRPPGRRLLAVLSACHAAMPDRALLDEVIGFPSALLQAGFAGVVSSQVGVSDKSAALLVLAFFARIERGVAPARALADAQRWLRSATNEEIHRVLPRLHMPPDGRSGTLLTQWLADQPYTEPYAWATFSYSGA